jgi:multiple sugar transport system permease protein
MNPRLARIGPNIGIAAIFLAYALPLLMVVLASFKSNADIVNRPADLFFTPSLDGYSSVFTPQFFQSVGNSAILAVSATALTLVVATPLAYVLSRARAATGSVIIGVLIALQMTPAASAVIPQFKVMATLGLLGTTLGVVLAMSAGALPYAVLILRPFYLSVPAEVEEAAYVDGAGQFRTFAQVVFPLVRNGVSLIGVLLFIGAWGEFLYPITFFSDASLFPLSVTIAQQQGVYGTHWNNLMALALVGAIPTIVIFTFVARRLTSGLALGVGK